MLFVLLSLLSSLIVFFGVSIDSSAESVLMTYDEFIAIFGSSLPAHVTLQGGDTYDITLSAFSYSYAPNGWDVSQNPVCNSSQSAGAFRYAYYAGSIFPSGGGKTPVESMTIDFQATFDNAHWGFFVSDSSSFAVSSSWLLANSSCSAGQFGFISSNSDSSKIAKANWGLLERDMKFCPFYSDGDTVSIDGITVTNFQTEGQSTICIGFMCPLYDDNFQQGVPAQTTVTTTSQPSYTIDVNVDMSQTNTILGGISDILSGLVSGIQGLFVPSEEWINQWLQAMKNALLDAFGDIPELQDQLQTAIRNLINNSAVQTIHFDGVSPPGVGQIIAPRDVPLRPSGFESLYSFIRVAVNLVATIAVVNMLLNKFKAVLVGEVVIDDGG